MKKLSPALSPMLAFIVFYSSTVSFVYAAPQTIASSHSTYKADKSRHHSDANRLFDGNTAAKYAPKNAQIVERTYKMPVLVKELKVYGRADYILSVDYLVNGVWESTGILKNIALDKLTAGWNVISLPDGIMTEKVRMHLIPSKDDPEGISEIAFTKERQAAARNTVIHDRGHRDNTQRIYTLADVTPKTTTSADMSFAFETAYHPDQISKAVLSYDVSGVSGGASVIRAVNDEPAQGGLLLQALPDQKNQTHISEEINPLWLKPGQNKIKFIAHEKGEMPGDYRVSNVKLTLTTDRLPSKKESRLTAYALQPGLSYREFVYIRGFVETGDKKVKELTVKYQKVPVSSGAFEAMVKIRGKKDVTVTATLEDGTVLTQEVPVDTTLSPMQEKTVQLSSSGVTYFNTLDDNIENTKTVLADAGKDTEVAFRNAALHIKRESLRTDKKITVATLDNRDLPPLDQGMVNVTKDENGYRFLPHGIRFDADNELDLAYDESKIPEGMSAKDIKTYYFDEEAGRWMPLPKMHVASGIVTSTTNHFTDMINAVIKVPDAPQAKAYTATQIKDLKIANPGAKINLIQAPKATSSGDAQLSYPIEIPAGRHGMAPKIALNYSSGASNSWMGLGWNLSIPGISIETRWGVPRYDSSLETETYTIGGKQLSPLAHRSEPVAREAEKRFYPRVESGAFDKIVRHGNAPDNYWWEVTSKDGQKKYYGGNPTRGFDADAVLTDGSGNVAHWALAQSVDTYGNTVTYTYEKVADTGVASGSVQGYELYIKNINYTGYNSDQGAYDVAFIRDRDLGEAHRNDSIINAKLGFKRVTGDLLRKVEVKFQGSMVRSYEFAYTKGAFEKTLLHEIRQLDANGELFNTHTLNYFDEVSSSNGYTAFKPAKSWMSGAVPGVMEDDVISAPSLPALTTLDEGLQLPTVTTPETTTDTGTGSGTDTDTDTSTGTKPAIGSETALEHANYHSRLFRSLEDVAPNANGLFHRRHQSYSQQQVNVAGTTSPALQETAQGEEANLIYPSSDGEPIDYIYLWQAPFDGSVTIEAPVALLETEADEEADGVRVSIQDEDVELWSSDILPGDRTVKTPSSVSNVVVKKGERILFRVHPKDNSINDIVSWSPVITYGNKKTDIEDANKLPLYIYSAADEYIPQAKAVVMPYKGTVHIDGNITKAASSDDVKFSLIRFTEEGKQYKVWEQSYPTYEVTRAKPDFGSIGVDAGDRLFGLISTHSNVDFKTVTWSPVVTYETWEKSFYDRLVPGDLDPEEFREGILPHYTIHQAITNSYGWVSNKDTNLSVQAVIPLSFSDSGTVNFTVKTNGRLMAKQAIKIEGGFIQGNEPLSVYVAKGDRVYFEYNYVGTLGDTIPSEWTPIVTAGGRSVAVDSLGIYHLPPTDTAVYYRGWGEFVYRASAEEGASAIDPDALQQVPPELVVKAERNGDDDNSSVSLAENDAQSVITTVETDGDTTSSSDTTAVRLPTTTTTSTSYTATSASGLPGDASALSGGLSTSSSVHFAGTIGLPGNPSTKDATVGAKKGSSKSENDGTLALVDIDGDSLPDQVVKKSSGLAYRKNLSHHGIESFAPLKAISGINKFQHSKTSSSNSGAEVYYHLMAGTNKSRSTTTTDIYFSDVNGDGLIDVVKKGVAYFNRLDADGVPTFSTSSSGTPNPVVNTVSLGGSGWIEPQTPEELAQLEAENPLHDTVRVWIAPADGTVAVTAPVNLIEDTSPQRAEYETADGVEVAIQHAAKELWRTAIGATDYTVKNPTGVNAINVKKGERIYFRVHSIEDGSYDRVYWAPKIVYTDKAQTYDANGLADYSFDVNEEFMLPGLTVMMPMAGTVKLASSFSKSETTDDVIIRMVKVDNLGNVLATIMEENMGQGAVSKPVELVRSVDADETYRFDIVADTNVDWSKIKWNPNIYYTEIPGKEQNQIFDSDGNPYYLFKTTPNHRVYFEEYYPTTPWVADGNETVYISPEVTAALGSNLSGDVVFTIKKDRQLIGKQSLSYLNGELTSSPASVDLNVTAGEIFYLEYHTKNKELASLFNTKDVNASIFILANEPGEDNVTIHYKAGQYGYRNSTYEYQYGMLYRNWGQFVYNASVTGATKAIDETELYVNEDKNSEGDYTYNPTSDPFLMMVPDAFSKAFIGADKASAIDATTISASRFGEKYVRETTDQYSSDGVTVRGIPKKTKTVSSGGALAGLSDTKQTTSILTDFKDLNGDRYPDVIGQNQVQYTTMQGSLEAEAINSLGSMPGISDSNSHSISTGTFAAVASVANAVGDTATSATTNDPLGGFSANIGSADDSTKEGLRDINGDGLPDRVYKGGDVSLNLGYSFAARENWGFDEVQSGDSSPFGMGLGFSISSYSIAGGLSVNYSDNYHRHSLMDVNGDGLADEIIDNGGVKVRLNTGSGFTAPVAWNGIGKIYSSKSTNEAANAAYTACWHVVVFVPVLRICVNPGGSIGRGHSHDESTLTDIDGDGLLDYLSSDGAGDLSVRYSAIGKTNLLKSIERPLGAVISLDYAKSGNTYDNPHHKWVLSSVETFDGHTGDGADVTKQNISYDYGYYDRHERDAYGFAWVITEDIDTQNNDAVYRKTYNHYVNTNYYEKGTMDYTVTTDGADNVYIEKYNDYSTVNVFTNQELFESEKYGDFQNTYTKLVRTVTAAHEGDAAESIQTVQTFRYDTFGNIVRQDDLGDPADPRDDYTAIVSYYQDLENYILSVPQTIHITNSQGVLMRHREATVDAYGSVTQVRIDTGEGMLTTDIAYDEYGNISGITYPANSKGQRYALSYTIDDVIHTYTTTMTDSFGYTATAQYDYRFGAQVLQKDINDQPIVTTYDAKGRIATVMGPLEADKGVSTIRNSYYPNASTPYAVIAHYDEGRTDTLDTVTFVDGLQRVIQTKKDAAVDDDKDGVATDGMTVSGHVKFDAFGRTAATYYPLSEGVGYKETFNTSINSVEPTRTTYDILNRKVTTVFPDGESLSNAYGFASDKEGVTRFHTQSTDANGKVSENFKDARERITAVLLHNAAAGWNDIWMTYSYNAVNELLQVTDNKGHLTQAVYDLAGRRTHLYNPDTGWVESVYDDAGNVIQKITENLRAENKAITYDYDYNRLNSISYPNTPANNITYTYGSSANSAGRITKIVDRSGQRLFEYGKLGETTKETRTVKSLKYTTDGTYVTQYRYDTWNRLRELIYPDGEVLTHTYDSGGKLTHLEGKKGTYSYPYLESMTYDSFGQRVYVGYANGTHDTYSYEEERRRLSHLVGANANRTFMDNTYTYDAMQNITAVINSAAVTDETDGYGGRMEQHFVYDDLYQMTAANGIWNNRNSHEHRYSLEMGYDTIGNILRKKQHHARLTSTDTAWQTQGATSYDWHYTYAGTQPHAPTTIGKREFAYDLNGNQTGWKNPFAGSHREIVWNEENRIERITDNDLDVSVYHYDDKGDRILKYVNGAEEIRYVNPYYVVRQGSVASKHVFAGKQRIAVKMSNDSYEDNQYYFHPDHLGSSSFMTNTTGEVFEHIEYFPFGETWADEHSDNKNVPYKFTGKELDEETGLYYYGARYYDPRTSVWQSPDPILEKYMDGKPNGGVQNPINLSLYTYSANNPTNLKDPNGEFFWFAVGAALAVADAVDNYREGGWEAVGEGLAKDALITVATGGIGKVVSKGAKLAKKSIQTYKNSQGKTINLKHKSNWSQEQKAQAKMKTKQLTKANTVVSKGNKASRQGTQSIFRKEANLDAKTDADHIQDLQLGGEDVMSNMQGLDSSVNRSLGSQINNAIKDMPDGTKIGKVKIK